MKVAARRLTTASCLGLGLAIYGCASVDPQPFESFHESVAALQVGADEALAAAQTMAAAGFAQSSPFDETLTFEQLVLTWEPDGDPTRPTQAVTPLHSTLRDLRRGTFDLNQAVAGYSRYLSLLIPSSIIGRLFEPPGVVAFGNSRPWTEFENTQVDEVLLAAVRPPGEDRDQKLKRHRVHRPQRTPVRMPEVDRRPRSCPPLLLRNRSRFGSADFWHWTGCD